jgi:hypothetical protein
MALSDRSSRDAAGFSRREPEGCGEPILTTAAGISSSGSSRLRWRPPHVGGTEARPGSCGADRRDEMGVGEVWTCNSRPRGFLAARTSVLDPAAAVGAPGWDAGLRGRDADHTCRQPGRWVDDTRKAA